MADPDLAKFYNDLQTVPKLVSDLALSIAEAQRRLDHDYLENLAEFVKVIATVGPLVNQGDVTSPDTAKSDGFMTLFKRLAPSRYQFTETVLEVKADIQMAGATEFGGAVNVGIKASVFALAINASYTKRSAYDAHSSAIIRTTLNAITDDTIMDKLLPRAGEVPHATERISGRYAELAEAFTALLKLAPGGAQTSP
jgi:hypothetical protein